MNVFAEHSDLERFQRLLLEWYDAYKRVLPWRETKDPYKIWISEVVLQQTRVDQALDYYNRFVERFATIKDLAMANEEEVLRYWQGLGYYSRARNLHAAAKWVVDTFEGKFPQKYEDVLKMKGVGKYTVAAICSFAYNMPTAVVDGNVYRFLARYFGVESAIDSVEGQKCFKELADELMNKNHPSSHNQAMMEMGALQCVPINPKCEECPFVGDCVAWKMKKVDILPRKEKKTKVRDRFFIYIKVENGGKVYLHKRIANDVWKNLYELPLVEVDRRMQIEEIVVLDEFRKIVGAEACIDADVKCIKHILSHQRINAMWLNVRIDDPTKWLKENCMEVSMDEVAKYPISRLVEKIFQ